MMRKKTSKFYYLTYHNIIIISYRQAFGDPPPIKVTPDICELHIFSVNGRCLEFNHVKTSLSTHMSALMAKLSRTETFNIRGLGATTLHMTRKSTHERKDILHKGCSV